LRMMQGQVVRRLPARLLEKLISCCRSSELKIG
jgi:hypothetical protein